MVLGIAAQPTRIYGHLNMASLARCLRNRVLRDFGVCIQYGCKNPVRRGWCVPKSGVAKFRVHACASGSFLYFRFLAATWKSGVLLTSSALNSYRLLAAMSIAHECDQAIPPLHQS